ncbi:hypothetical protein HDU83_000921 [Entophlyctis luteolus]|nr:hypothetical protein HDU83_000921 [Entophlyctis luteolus]
MDVLIIGGGMAGMLLALGLKRAGHTPVVYERADFVQAIRNGERGPNGAPLMPQFGELGGGLGIVRNGGSVLKEFGVWDDVAAAGSQRTNCLFCRIDGTLITEVDTHDPDGSVYIQRSKLHQVIMQAAMKAGVKLFVCKQLVDLKQDDGKVTAIFKDGTKAVGDVLFGADGIHSATRSLLFDPQTTDDSPIFAGNYGHVGVTKLQPDDPILSKANFGACFFTDTVNKKSVELIRTSDTSYSFRVSDFSFDQTELESWTPVADLPKEAPRLAALVTSWNVPAIAGEIIEKASRIAPVSIYDRKSLKSWTVGRVTLVGDAAHGMPPYLGQGTNQAFEDVAALVELFTRFPSDYETCFKVYEAVRIKRTTKFAENSRRMGNAQYAKSWLGKIVGEIGLKGFALLANLKMFNFDWDWKLEIDKELKTLGK